MKYLKTSRLSPIEVNDTEVISKQLARLLTR